MEPSAAGAGRVLHNSILWPRAASTGVIRRDAPGRLPRRYAIDATAKPDDPLILLVFNAGLGSTSSPAPAVKEPAAPEQLPALRAQPVGHHVERTRCDHHHGQHGTASINQALGRGSRRALRAPSRGAGRHAAPSSEPRRLDGVSVVRSCARPRGGARAVAAAAPSPRVGAASCRGFGPTVRASRCRVFSARRLGGGRAVAPHGRPARMRERRAPEGPLHAIDAT